MKKALMVLVVLSVMVGSIISWAFYLYVGQAKSEVIAAIGKPNYSEISVDAIQGKIERCQWGSERAGTMVIIYFKDDKVIRFETKGKVN
jgi:hypothetical protein